MLQWVARIDRDPQSRIDAALGDWLWSFADAVVDCLGDPAVPRADAARRVLSGYAQRMSTQLHLETLRRWISMAEQDFTGDFLDVFTPDYQGHIAGRVHLDLEGLRQTEVGFGQAFFDTQRTVHELLAFDDRAVMRVTTEATHVGAFRGIPATGRRIRFTALVLYRFQDQRICESWTELDLAGLLQTLLAEGPRP